MFNRIVVGTDGSETAAEAVRQAVELAKLTGATLSIVSAYAPVPKGRIEGERRTPRQTSSMRSVPARTSTSFSRRQRPMPRRRGWRPRPTRLRATPPRGSSGSPRRRSADLIVVGNKGMAGARRFLLGSVPNNVSHHAPCSVIIVRTT